MNKKIIVTFVMAILVCIMLPVMAHAADRTVADGATFEFGVDDCNSGDVIRVDGGATVTLKGTAPNDVKVICGNNTNITLDNVKLDTSNISKPAIEIGETTTINLIGESEVKGCVYVFGNQTLTLQGTGKQGTGKLTAIGEGLGTGIGSPYVNVRCGNIIIKSGEIIATGARVGIGSDYTDDSNNGYILIEGGTVTATSSNGAGIGSSMGSRSRPVDITITGGTVTANGGGGAGIGGGAMNACGDIKITGGIVNATSQSGAGIGGGAEASGSNITIEGGTIKAISTYGAGIGGGYKATNDGDRITGGNITISGGTVTATSLSADAGSYGVLGGAGIGGGLNCDSGNITITGGTVYASGNTTANAQDIGHGSQFLGYVPSDGELQISGSNSAVFVENGSTGSIVPTTSHSYFEYSDSSDTAGYSIPSGWSYPVGSYQVNKAPAFTADAQNTSQKVVPGDSIAPLKASDHNGASDIVGYTLVSGSLPAGVVFNNDGTFTGDPYDLGTYPLTFEVRDANGLTDTTTLTLKVCDVVVNASPKTTTLGFGETCTISATTYPVGRLVEYFSSDRDVATVDINTGVVTAQSKQGRVLIHAVSNMSEDSVTLYVVDKLEPAPKPSDPVRAVSVELKDDSGNPMAGVAVSIFSEPQTVMTDSNGIAVFQNVPYNTNDPHTLIIQDFRGMEIGRYNLSFTSGATNSASVVGDDINVMFNDTISNTILTFTTREGAVQDITASIDTKPVVVQKVENPQTGDFESGSLTTKYLLLLIVCAIALLIYLKIQNRANGTITK